ncbi:cytochrome P450 [Streptomyces sp. BA2]|uniref:cytochrome P450 n=1 Tax=Streptomyces sp. BA2 TaxID=436595 RepID=UPI0013218E16|nr:cytochrome P450 [Streptomyces sp. BA2]
MPNSPDLLAEFPLRRPDGISPPPLLAELRDGEPRRVRLPYGSEPWLLTRHADVRAALAHPGLSADSSNPGLPRVSPLPPGPSQVSFLRMDDPDHGRLRRTVTPEFTHRRIQELRPGIRMTAERVFDALARRTPPVDFIEAVALPLPALVIGGVLGVPEEDLDFFGGKCAVIASTVARPEEIGAAYAEMTAYLDDLIAAKEKEPGEDLLGRVIRRHLTTGTLDHGELVAVAQLLIAAGLDTTSNMIGLACAMLLRHPEQFAALRADADLIPSAVDELLRILTIVQHGTVRVATRDVTIGGLRIAEGDGVICSLVAADHDEGVFPDAGRFDVRRDASAHLAFGHGVHQCLGQPLARAELEIVLRLLCERFPTLHRPHDAEELRFREESFVHGLHTLQVAW